MAFSLGNPSSYAAIPALSDIIANVQIHNVRLASLSSAGTSETWTASQMLAGIFIRSGGTTTTATTDTATNLVSALGPTVFVGMTFMVFYVNLSSGTATVAAGTGVTTSGTLTIATAGMRVFIGTVTNVTTPAVTLQSAFALGSAVTA